MKYKIKIRGLVQGVGFRPFIYLLANGMGLSGTVENCNDGVIVNVDASYAKLRELINKIQKEAPKIAEITSIQCQRIESGEMHPWQKFSILPSSVSDGFTQVSPDIAVCDDCLADLIAQPRRNNYAFINCTHCGPRFTIIKGLPYDRSSTTMAPFKMCRECQEEYNNPLDRRFHAQPTGCNQCGVHYQWNDITDYAAILEEMVRRLEHGEIIALKGMGGYNLICDALNESSIRHMRVLKHRPNKPFAIMLPNIKVAHDLLDISDKEAEILQSWRRPIVILKGVESSLTEFLAPGYSSLGVMLPYMVVHYDIFRESWLRALVVTSGNDDNEPMITDDDEARRLFSEKMGLMTISYDREIYNRIDDSLAQITDGREQVLRRARGYVPQPLQMQLDVDGILAMGADMIGQFMIGRHQSAIGSQYIGDLADVDNEEFYDNSLSNFFSLFSFSPSLIVIDAHPGYISSQKGIKLADKYSVPSLKIWHHHAHACAVMAEHNIHDEVIAIVLDGTGYGPDSTIWGGEILRCDTNEFARLWHLPMLPLPGADIASKEPWRMAVSILLSTYGDLCKLPKDISDSIGMEKIKVVEQMVKSKFNSPYSSGAGRLWDAVAALLGVAYHNSYEGEAPILLEQHAVNGIKTSYECGLENYAELLDCILQDLNSGLDTGIIAARFHNTMADAFAQKALELGTVAGLKKVVLAGGVMHNRMFVERLAAQLRADGLQVYIPERYPAGDGGIALGQLYIAANYRIKNRSKFFYHA